MWIYTKGPIPDGLFVCHGCDNPRCLNPDHLFLGTHADNMADKVHKGRSPKGEDHPMVILDEDQAAEILFSGERGVDLAEKMGVSTSTVSAIRHRRIWKHLQGAS